MLQSIDRLQCAIDSTVIKYHLRRHDLTSPVPYFPLTLETSRFTIKTADTLEEFNQVLRLRYEVFFKEQLHKTMPVRIDIDDYDFICDHLLIIDNATSKVVGTYRLISSQISKTFYSQNEFQIDRLLAQPEHKLELGRACIHKDFRNGIVMTLLWRGLSEYMKRSGSRYLFGCTSVKTTDPLLSALIVRYLEQRGVRSDDFQIKPTKKFEFQSMMESLTSLGTSIGSFNDAFQSTFLPPLLKGYLRAGAQIHGMPSLDTSFRCIDLFTVFDLQLANQAYREKFGMGGDA